MQTNAAHRSRRLPLRATLSAGLAVLLILGWPLAPARADAPSNDTSATAKELSLPADESLDTTEATTQLDEVASCTDNIEAAVWYRFTATEDETLEAHTVGSDFDTVIVVFEGSASSENEIACSDDFMSEPQSRLRFDTVSGQEYLILVGAAEGAAGTSRLRVNEPPGSGGLQFGTHEVGGYRLPRGSARIEITITCSVPLNVRVEGVVTQGHGAEGEIPRTWLVCESDARTYSLIATPGDIPFLPGLADVQLTSRICRLVSSGIVCVGGWAQYQARLLNPEIDDAGFPLLLN